MPRISTSSRVLWKPPKLVRWSRHSWANAAVKPGTASSSSRVAWLRLTGTMVVPEAVLANGTLICSPSLSRPARLGARDMSASALNPPAAAMASKTRSPRGRRYRPGFSTAPTMSTNSPGWGGISRAGAATGAVGAGKPDAVYAYAATSSAAAVVIGAAISTIRFQPGTSRIGRRTGRGYRGPDQTKSQVVKAGSRGRIRTFGRGSKVLCLTAWPPGSAHNSTARLSRRPQARRDLKRVSFVASGDEKRARGHWAGAADGGLRRLPLSGQLAVALARDRPRERHRQVGAVRACGAGGLDVRRAARGEPGD